MAISSVIIDSREPEHIQKLSFGGVPTATAMLDYGDLHVLCDDDCLLIIERKTSDDLLNSIEDERLVMQMAKCAQARSFAQTSPVSNESIWPYLIITGVCHPLRDGKVVTERGVTGWNWSAVMGELLSIQELGIGVVFCPSEDDFEATVIRLSKRKREPEKQILPNKYPSILSPGHQVIASLPGIGLERLKIAMEYAGNMPGWALVGLTDPDIEYRGIPKNVKKQIRAALKLKPDERLEIISVEQNGDKNE